MFERILLAVDGSGHALHAVKVAAELAGAMKSEQVRIVYCYDRIPSYLGEPNFQQAINTRLVEAEKILNEAVETLGTVPAEVHTEMIEGDPAELIIEIARTRNSSVIVMGSRGLGRLAGLLLGSTSQKVVSHAPCPVLIVR
jgi:nucleotide-binding universal stress UspA family protein